MQDQPAALVTMLSHQVDKRFVTRRLVYYFHQDVITKIITDIAQEKHLFVGTYLNLLSKPS